MIAAHSLLHVSTKTHKAPTLIPSIAVAEVLVVKAIGVSEEPAVAPGQQQQQIQADDQQGALKTQHDAVPAEENIQINFIQQNSTGAQWRKQQQANKKL